MDAPEPSTPPGPIIDSNNTTNEILNNAKTPPAVSPSLQEPPTTPRPSTPDSTASIPRPNLGPIYSAVYSGVPVYEFLVREVAVMRRRPDSYLNATQILKVAGLEKGKRTKIIEKEVLTGEHEKVQGGYGKYQGTWVPYERGKELAEQYGVLEILRPLLEYKPPVHDIPYSSSPYTPTKEQAMAALRRQAAKATSNSPSSQINIQNSINSPIIQNMVVVNNGNGGGNVNSNVNGNNNNNNNGNGNNGIGNNNNNNNGNNGNGIGSNSNNNGNENENAAVTPSEVSEPPLTTSDVDETERQRNVLMAIFLNEDPNQLPDLLSNPSSPEDIDYDSVIDDHGHTALHWAASLARLQVMELLLTRGANVKQVNNEGESALIRAILVSNNYEAQTFPAVINLLHDTIPMTDKDNRTVFHHIAMTSGTKGHAAAAKYYMDCLQQWIAKNIKGNISSILNIQDKNGDTALNISARVGNRQLVRQLMEMGASKNIENKIGLKAEDFDNTEFMEYDDVNERKSDNPPTEYFIQPIQPVQSIQPSLISLNYPNRKSHDIGLSIQKIIDDAEIEWIEQLRLKENQLAETRRQYNITSKLLAEAKRVTHYYKQNEKDFDATEEYIQHLEKVLVAEGQDETYTSCKRQKIEHSNGETSALDVLSTVSISLPTTIADFSQLDINKTDSPKPMVDANNNNNNNNNTTTTATSPSPPQPPQVIKSEIPVSGPSQTSSSSIFNTNTTNTTPSPPTSNNNNNNSIPSSSSSSVTPSSALSLQQTTFSSSTRVPSAFPLPNSFQSSIPNTFNLSLADKPPTITITPPSNGQQSQSQSQSQQQQQPTSSTTSTTTPLTTPSNGQSQPSPPSSSSPIANIVSQINAYSKENELLRQEIKSVREMSYNIVLDYKRIISTCCKIEFEKVDDYVESMVVAFDSDKVDFNNPYFHDLMHKPQS